MKTQNVNSINLLNRKYKSFTNPLMLTSPQKTCLLSNYDNHKILELNNTYYPLFKGKQLELQKKYPKEFRKYFDLYYKKLKDMSCIQKNNYLNNLFTSSDEIDNCFLTFLHSQSFLTRDNLSSIAKKFPEKIGKEDFNYLVANKIALTDVDTPAIIEHRLKCQNCHMFNVNDNEYLMNIDKILEHEFKLVDSAKAEKKMIIITGLPASGKSTYLKENYNIQDYYLGDVDKIKTLFPSYNVTGKKYNSLHNIARQIIQTIIFPKVINNNKNILIPTTGLPEYVERLAKPAKEKGYHTTLIHVQIPGITAMKNVINRYNNTGIFVDPFFVAIRAPFMGELATCFKNSTLIDNLKVIASPFS